MLPLSSFTVASPRPHQLWFESAEARISKPHFQHFSQDDVATSLPPSKINLSWQRVLNPQSLYKLNMLTFNPSVGLRTISCSSSMKYISFHHKIELIFSVSQNFKRKSSNFFHQFHKTSFKRFRISTVNLYHPDVIRIEIQP